MPYFGQDLFNAFGKLESGEEMTDVEQRHFSGKTKSNGCINSSRRSCIRIPIMELNNPSKLQTFIDYVYQAGFTFKYDENGQIVQLMTDKKAIILSARGGVYSTPEAAPMEMAVNYIKNVVGGVFGMEIVREVIIEGHAGAPDQAEAIIAEGLEKVADVAKSLSAVTA